jgi:hypothetical protein
MLDDSVTSTSRPTRWAMCLRPARDAEGLSRRLAHRRGPRQGLYRQRGMAARCPGLLDVLQAQGDLAGALKAYRDGLRIAERIAKADPGNARWQFDLASSYWRLAENGDEPAENWQKVIDILQRLDDDGSCRSIENGSTKPRRGLRRCESDTAPCYRRSPMRRADRRWPKRYSRHGWRICEALKFLFLARQTIARGHTMWSFAG